MTLVFGERAARVDPDREPPPAHRSDDTGLMACLPLRTPPDPWSRSSHPVVDIAPGALEAIVRTLLTWT
ncbi:hypothetical protein [Streptomyces sp. NPDC047061]|uniref:hypothetical protein n=1 Tax=Streptomyces sp. NPDC047061 TaxID=3154605 RepID=UPI0033C4DA52